MTGKQISTKTRRSFPKVTAARKCRQGPWQGGVSTQVHRADSGAPMTASCLPSHRLGETRYPPPTRV